MGMLLWSKIKSFPRHLWILLVIICLGAFLRTYNLHEWMEFRGDQVRDSYLVDRVVSGESAWPLLGPYMYNSGSSKEMFYHLGPAYYYFQIISAKIFGSYPDKMAYPDVFFSILSIPLFYLFLRVYFRRNLSLGIVLVYAISSYFIHYSRFAWNSNLIPFFVLLFLFSLHKILVANEKTHWLWVAVFGFAWGIGFQLHAITMLLFSIIAFFSFLFSMKNNPKIFSRWVVIVLIFITLNGGQIVNEVNTNFGNTKRLLNFSSQGGGASESKFALFGKDIACHIEANSFFLSSYGSNNCSYGILNFLPSISDGGISKITKNWTYWSVLLLSLIFSGISYFLLVYCSRKEKEREGLFFLRLIALYAGINFLIMVPLSVEKFSDLRYLTPVFFVPFVMLGLVAKVVYEKFSKKFIILIVAILILLVSSNFIDISSEAKVLLEKNRTCSSHFTTLGEVEAVADYIVKDSGGEKNIQIGGYRELLVAVDPLEYLLKKRGISPIKVATEKYLSSSDSPAFFISCRSKFGELYDYEKIGNIYVYNVVNINK